MRQPGFLEPPVQGSRLAERVDELFSVSVGIALFFSVLIAVLIAYLSSKYRRRPDRAGTVTVTEGSREPVALEVTWALIPLGITLYLFYWGAEVFMELSRPPANADEYYVIGRQWMWKVQHPQGPREINELHAPVGRPIKLLMTSEDVIHSFYVPAFRTKMDVLPGRYTTVWFEADKPGVYHLFCAEYCGTEHSKMVGRVVILEQHQYDEWLSGGGQQPPVATTGETLFQAHGCATCHRPDTAVRAPILHGLAGKTVQLASGEAVVADETYIRESIAQPAAKLVAGYPPIMPAYGQLSEEELLALVIYVRSLAGDAAGAPGGPDLSDGGLPAVADGGAPDGGASPDGGPADGGTADGGALPDGGGLPDAGWIRDGGSGLPDGGGIRDAGRVLDGAVPLGEPGEGGGSDR